MQTMTRAKPARRSSGRDDPRAVVVDRRFLDDLEAEVRQPGGEPGGVRVDELSAGELGPDAEHGARHGTRESTLKSGACRFAGAVPARTLLQRRRSIGRAPVRLANHVA